MHARANIDKCVSCGWLVNHCTCEVNKQQTLKVLYWNIAIALMKLYIAWEVGITAIAIIIVCHKCTCNGWPCTALFFGQNVGWIHAALQYS